MFRLLRVVFGLLILNMVGVVVVIAIHYDDARWGCIRSATSGDGLAVLDLQHKTYFIENRVPVPNGVILSGTDDYLMYDYISPAGQHRIGTIDSLNSSSAYLDLPTSPSLLSKQYALSSNFKFMPISTYNSTARTQTITIYALPALQPTLSAVQSDIAPPQSSNFASAGPPILWSPNDQWFTYVTSTTSGNVLTIMSPSKRLARSFTLSSTIIDDLTLIWSGTEQALAIASESDQSIEILTTIDEDWLQVSSFKYRSDTGNPLFLAYWSVDGQILYFHKYALGMGSSEAFFEFRLDDQRVQPAQIEQYEGQNLRLDKQWLCKFVAGAADKTNPDLLDYPALISLTNEHAPLMLYANFGESAESCDPIFQSPDTTKMIVALRSTHADQREWFGLTATPFLPTALSLPSTTATIVGWTPDSKKAFFFAPDPQPSTNYQSGSLGIVDTTTWTWVMINQPIALQQKNRLSTAQIAPDSTRFVSLAADSSQALLFNVDGELISPLAPISSFFTENWSPDSTKLLITAYRGVGVSVIYLYDRDGHLLSNMEAPPDFGSVSNIVWSHCEPTPKLPRLNLPQ